MVRRGGVIAIITISTMAAGIAYAATGTLRIGDVTVEETRISVPVMLECEASPGVAVLDFRVNYDAEVFYPISVEPGISAVAAEKDVLANEAQSGQYILVVMGMTRRVCEPGEIVHLTFGYKADSSVSESELSVSDTTFSTLDGVVIPSRGSRAIVKLASDSSDDGSPSPPSIEPPVPPMPEPTPRPQPSSGKSGNGSMPLAPDAGTKAGVQEQLAQADALRNGLPTSQEREEGAAGPDAQTMDNEPRPVEKKSDAAAVEKRATAGTDTDQQNIEKRDNARQDMDSRERMTTRQWLVHTTRGRFITAAVVAVAVSAAAMMLVRRKQ